MNLHALSRTGGRGALQSTREAREARVRSSEWSGGLEACTYEMLNALAESLERASTQRLNPRN